MTKAVITGDIIHSTQMENDMRLELFNLIKNSLKIWDKDYHMKSEMFRGDSFQCLLKLPFISLRLALIIKTYVRSLNPIDFYDVKKVNSNQEKKMHQTNWLFDVRIGLGIGEVDSETKTLANSNGEAFHLSGSALDELKDSKQHLAVKTNDEFREEWETSIILLDAIMSKTSALQCQVLNLKLLGYTEIQIAQRLDVGQSAINQRSVSGNWNAINAMVKRFENVYAHG